MPPVVAPHPANSVWGGMVYQCDSGLHTVHCKTERVGYNREERSPIQKLRVATSVSHRSHGQFRRRTTMPSSGDSCWSTTLPFSRAHASAMSTAATSERSPAPTSVTASSSSLADSPQPGSNWTWSDCYEVTRLTDRISHKPAFPSATIECYRIHPMSCLHNSIDQ